MKPEIIYKFACGNIGPAKKKSHKNICPKCGSGIVGRPRVCEVCGSGFIGGVHGKRSAKCQNCQDEADLVRHEAKTNAKKRIENKRRDQNLGIAQALAKREAQRNMKPNCLFFEHCLNFDLKENPKYCLRCEHYLYKNLNYGRGSSSGAMERRDQAL